jgi:hypothetical protein
MNIHLPSVTHYLQCIGEVVIPETKAGRGISIYNQTLFYSVDVNFSFDEGKTLSKDTSEMKASVYQLTRKGGFVEVFSSISSQLDTICIETYEQAEQMIKIFPEYFSGDNSVHFLFKNIKKEFSILNVRRIAGGGMNAFLYQFSNTEIWTLKRNCLFIALQKNNI